MSINDGSYLELWKEYLKGNPTVGATNPQTICRGTTIVGSYYIDTAYGGVAWRQTFYTDSSSNVVAITAVTTV